MIGNLSNRVKGWLLVVAQGESLSVLSLGKEISKKIVVIWMSRIKEWFQRGMSAAYSLKSCFVKFKILHKVYFQALAVTFSFKYIIIKYCSHQNWLNFNLEYQKHKRFEIFTRVKNGFMESAPEIGYNVSPALVSNWHAHVQQILLDIWI